MIFKDKLFSLASLLRYRPDTKPYRRQTPAASSTEQTEAETKKHFTTRIQSNDYCGGDIDQTDDQVKTNQSILLDGNAGSVDSSPGEELDKFRAEILKRTRTVDNNEDVIVEPQFEDDDLFSSGPFVSNATVGSTALGHGQSPRPNKLIGVESKQNQAIADEVYKDHDDELSTIAETSEPSTPTVYSFQTNHSFEGSESSHTIGTDDGLQGSFDDSHSSPTISSHDITPLNSLQDAESSTVFGLDEPDSINKQNNASVGKFAPSRTDGQFLKASTVLPGSSYTIISSDMSLEAAKAAGLPIIESNYDDIEINSFDSAILDENLKAVSSFGEHQLAVKGEMGSEYVQGNWERNLPSHHTVDDRLSRHHEDVPRMDYNGCESEGSSSQKVKGAFEGGILSAPTTAKNDAAESDIKDSNIVRKKRTPCFENGIQRGSRIANESKENALSKFIDRGNKSNDSAVVLSNEPSVDRPLDLLPHISWPIMDDVNVKVELKVSESYQNHFLSK